MRPGGKQRLAGILLTFFVVSTVIGCTVGRNYQAPDVDKSMEDNWQAASLSVSGELDQHNQPPPFWWRQFNDDALNSLIDQLFSSSLALAAAKQRILEFGARRGVVQADKQLQLAAALDHTHVKVGDEAVSLLGQPPGVSKDIYSTGVVAGWELDLWGRIARLVEAAGADIGAEHAGYQALLVSLAAELTLAYVNERTIEARLAMIRQNIALQEKTLELAENRLQAGNGTSLAVERTRRLLQSTRANVPELERARTEAENRINVLLGQPPGKTALQPGPMPVVPRLIGLGLPVDLLVRRPDIRAAYHRYHAAVARTGAAEAEQYPRLTLAGTLTISSDILGDMIDPDSLIYSLGPGLSFPLLTGGRIKSNIKIRTSQEEQAHLALEQKIVEALAEVENSAVGVVRSQEKIASLDSAEQAARNSVTMAESLYQTGLGDFFQVLDNEQQLVVIQDSLLLARQQALSDVVRLYRALGGGWETGAENGSNR